MPTPLPHWKRALNLLMLAAAALLLGLHFVHLRADFPNGSPWMDWSKYTDEGWYGDAAIRHFQRGSWYVAGDFNPAAALPVLPVAEGLLFAFTGVSLLAARALTAAIFGGILTAAFSLLKKRLGAPSQAVSSPQVGWATASIPVLLLAANPFCFVFTRMAIIEPLLVLLMLLAFLTASRKQRPVRLTPPSETVSILRHGITAARANWLTILLLGLLLPLLILTKTTALFLTPAIAWMLFARSGYRIPQFLRLAIPAGCLGVALWLLYYLAVVRPHFLPDYRYLFSANSYTGMKRENWLSVLALTLKDGKWMGPIYPFAAAAFVFALARPHRLRESPLVVALLLWISGYAAFLAYHNNLQPRYYLVVAVPLTLLLPVVFDELMMPLVSRAAVRKLALGCAGLVVVSILLPDTIQTVGFVRHPEYTLVDAAASIARAIAQDRRSDPSHNPLILSISGSDISLMTGLPSICDDFGTMELVDRIRKYQPGWYVAWNQVEDDKMDAIAPQFRLDRVAAFPAMDDPNRNLLILYKILPVQDASPAPARRKPHRTIVKTGQQPSLNQLVH